MPLADLAEPLATTWPTSEPTPYNPLAEPVMHLAEPLADLATV